MIYENYFQVPDGEMCRPVANGTYEFFPKSRWSKHTCNKSYADHILGKWETQERTITITEREFNDAVRACKVSTYPTIFINLLKKELFK